MADKRCFVQFSHPGTEHGRKSGCDWHKSKFDHRRKFMQLHGKWIEGDGTKRSGVMWAWGEWEPESELIAEFNTQDGGPHHPRYLWKPYWVPRNSTGACTTPILSSLAIVSFIRTAVSCLGASAV